MAGNTPVVLWPASSTQLCPGPRVMPEGDSRGGSRRLVLAGTLAFALLAGGGAHAEALRGTGDLGVVIERAEGSLQVIETTTRTSLGRVEGLGDLSHASVSTAATGALPTSSGATAGSPRSTFWRARSPGG
jgi:hypothetical protein